MSRSVAARFGRPALTWPVIWAFASALLALPAAAQSSDSTRLDSLRAEVDSLKASQRSLLQELRDIRSLLERWMSRAGDSTRGAVPVMFVDTAGDPSRGHATAPITIVEFADYHCVYCGKFFKQTLPLLDTNYIGTGRVRLVFRDYPVLSLDASARRPAEAAHCAGDQDRFWQMHDLLFGNQGSLTSEVVRCR